MYLDKFSIKKPFIASFIFTNAWFSATFTSSFSNKEFHWHPDAGLFGRLSENCCREK